MAEVRYNVSNLVPADADAMAYLKRFGMHMPFPAANRPYAYGETQPFPDMELPEEDVWSLRQSALGTPLLFPVTFRHKSLAGGSITLPNEPLITVSLSKRIISTPVAGRDGAVKEIVSSEDYLVSMKGVGVPEHAMSGGAQPGRISGSVFPAKLLKSLNNLARINADLEVECELLAIFGINRLVMSKASFPFQEGRSDSVFYEFDFVSDNQYKLTLS